MPNEAFGLRERGKWAMQAVAEGRPGSAGTSSWPPCRCLMPNACCLMPLLLPFNPQSAIDGAYRIRRPSLSIFSFKTLRWADTLR